jgi:hypothetical protein
MSSFIDAVEQRARELGEGGVPTEGDWRQALTETLAEAGPVGEVQGMQWSLGGKPTLVCVRIGGPVPHGTLLFTAPPADERDARIAELEAKYQEERESRIEHSKGIVAARALNDELRTQLATAQAALTEAADDIADWGTYASDYFKEKHGLVACVAKYRAIATNQSEVLDANL